MADSSPVQEESVNKAKYFFAVLRRLGSYTRYVCLMVLLLLTLYVVSGRHLISFVEGYSDSIEARLSALLGEQVKITQLNGDWYRFSPVLTLEALEVSLPPSVDANQNKSHRIDSLRVEFDVVESLLRKSLIVKQVTLDELKLELIEDQQGRWSLAGLVRNERESNNKPLIDFLLNTAKLQLVEADLFLHRANGVRFELNNIYLQLLNDGQEHLLQAQLRLDGQESLMRFELALNGDPRQEYAGSGHVSFNSVDFTRLLTQGVAEKLLVEKDFDLTQASSSAEIWFEFDQHGLSLLQGELNDLVVLGGTADFSLDLSSARVDFSVLEKSDNLWQVWLDDLQFDWHQRPWGSSVFFAEIDGRGEALAFDVTVESLDLQTVTDMLEEFSLPTRARQSLADLHPTGRLNNVRFSTDLSGDYPGGFKFAANLQDVAVGAWSAAPSGYGINGYVEASQFNGLVELSSHDFGLHLPRVFAEGWQYNEINARVHWQLEEGVVRVNSSIIDVVNDDIHGRVQFDLNNTKKAEGGWNSNLTLLVGVSEFDASKKSVYLPTLEKIKGTMSWLDQALLAGDVENSGFIFRGVTAGDASAGSSTVQTFYNIKNAQLRFLEQWPALENLTAFVKVDNNNADITAQSAQLAGIQLVTTQATIRPNDTGVWLDVRGAGHASAEAGLALLRDTPIRDSIGEYLDGWQAEGEIALSIELGIPLNNDNLESIVQVGVVSADTVLTIPEYNLNFVAIEGQVDYHSDHGLTAGGLNARLFDAPIKVNIDNDLANNVQGTRITATGSASGAALQRWPGQSVFVRNVLGFTQGEIEYEAELSLFSHQSEEGLRSLLRLKSDLSGLAIELPAPFTKERNESGSLILEIGFLPSNELFTVEYGDSFYGQVLLDGELLKSGQLYFGELNKDFTIRQASNIFSSAEQGLLISGDFKYFDFDAWQVVSARFIDEEAEEDAADSMAEVVRLVDLSIEQLDVYGLELMAVDVLASRSGQSWQVALENELLAGSFNFPDSISQPYDIQLDYLRFPGKEETTEAVGEGDSDILTDIDPADLPNIDFNTAELRLEGRDMGVWSFSLRSHDAGATISDFKMEMEEAAITDMSGEAGANIDWGYSNGIHTSSFTGIFQVGDLSKVLPAWGYNAHVQSESAEFVGNLQWAGSPIAFSLLNASGQLDITIENGSFVDVESGSARLFGAFNFDSIERRLQLDFSDVYEKGLAYDRISGLLKLEQGIVNTDGKFLIQGPSSTINIEGELNLRDETINAEMLVNLPFSQNIAVVAGVLGAWPIAIGAYVAGKIFKDQLAQFTTVLYRLEGPWSDLSAGFESDTELVEDEMAEAGVAP